MENRCRVVLKRCGNVIGRNACKFDTKIILMPLWKETIAWTVDIARSLAMLQKNTQCTRSAHIEFWMQLNGLFNKCRRTVILIFTKLHHRKKSYRTWEHLSDGPLDQVFLKNLTDCHDESSQCFCHTITRSRLKLFESLVMFTSLFSPWDPYKLCCK